MIFQMSIILPSLYGLDQRWPDYILKMDSNPGHRSWTDGQQCNEQPSFLSVRKEQFGINSNKQICTEDYISMTLEFYIG